MRHLPSVSVATESAEATRELGRRLGRLLQPGDVVILSGELGAGKTTLTQGLGAGLQVRGPVTSPTFVIARLHPPLSTGAGLLHVDAYRMGDAAELDDLDLDTLTDRAVTVVEWGEGLAETLSTNRLHVGLARSSGAERAAEADVDAVGGSAEERRIITVTPVGERWVDAPLQQVLSSTESAANPNRPGPDVEP